MIFKNKNKLNVIEMQTLEKWVSENIHNIYGININEEQLSKQLNLKISYESSSNFPEGTEALLCPDNSKRYFGIIRINNKFKNKTNRFSYMHEIIHYIKDVGIGNYVTKEYTRKTKGKFKDKEEQEIDFITAASIMPFEEINNKLKAYDNNPKTDELLFINELCIKYNQEKKAIIRRIREVRILNKFNHV